MKFSVDVSVGGSENEHQTGETLNGGNLTAVKSLKLNTKCKGNLKSDSLYKMQCYVGSNIYL
jgi:hypothetical protein